MLFEALGLGKMSRECIAFVGAGGKTTSMFRLAEEMKLKGSCLIVTTTTKIYRPESHCYDTIMLSCNEEELQAELEQLVRPGIHLAAQGVDSDNKLIGLEPHWVDNLFWNPEPDHILVEADGSRGLPVKAPADFEPVIPSSATLVVGVIGLDCLGRPADESMVHRVHAFCRITGCSLGDIITDDHLIRLIMHPMGLFKAAPESSKRFLLLNKADDGERAVHAYRIRERMREQGLPVLIARNEKKEMNLL